MDRKIKRGDIYYADLAPIVGSEQDGIRPVLVIQNDTGNQHSPTVIVAAITSKKKTMQPTHISLAGVSDLKTDSIVLMEQIRTIDKRRMKDYVGTLNKSVMMKINRALAISVGLLNDIKEPLILCLCSVCADQFYNSPGHTIKRINYNQKHKELCMYCNVRTGFDFEIRNKMS